MLRRLLGRLLGEVKRARLIAVTGVAAVAGLTSSIVIGRVFGSDGRGEYAVAIATMMVVGQVASWGLGEGLAIHTSKGHRLRRPRLVVLLTWVGYGLAAASFALGFPDYTLIAVGSVACAIVLQVTSYSLTTGKTWLWAAGQLAQPVVVVAASITALTTASIGVTAITLAYALSPLLLVVPGLWVVGARPVGDGIARVSAILWSGTQRALSVNITALVRRVDILVLGLSVPIAQVGEYAVAISLLDLCLLAPMVLAGLVLRDELRGAQDSPRRIVGVTVGWMVPPVLAVVALGYWLIPAVWGPDFDSVHLTFLVLVPAAVAMGVGRNLQSWRAGRSEQGLVVRTTLGWAPLAGGLIAVSAALAGPLAAAAAVSVSYVALAVMLAVVKPRGISG